jgi:hypothetical protein
VDTLETADACASLTKALCKGTVGEKESALLSYYCCSLIRAEAGMVNIAGGQP